MEQLSERDLRMLLDFLRGNYSFQTSERFVEGLLTGLQKLVPANLVGWLETRPEPSKTVYHFDPPGVASERTHQTWEHIGDEHPVLTHFLNTGETAFYKISDFLSQTGYHRLALYNELYLGMDVEDVFGTFFPVSPSAMVAVALHRDRRTFSERDRLVLNLLQPHIMQAFRNIKAVAYVSEQNHMLEELLQSREEGIIVLSRDRRVRFMTSSGRRYVEEYFGSLGTSGRLPDNIDIWIRHQDESLHANKVPAPRTPLVLERQRTRLSVTLMWGEDHIVLNMLEEITTPDLTSLGLTRREADVLIWVARGKSNADIATILDMSTGTVKKHLEHIFQKLGVESRAAAAGSVTQILPHLTRRC